MSRPARLDHYAKPTSLAASERLLPTVWRLHDCPDVELLCRGVMAEIHPRDPLSWAELEDVLAFLFEQTVVIEQLYRPAEHPGIRFRPFLYARLRWKLCDLYRHEYGRRSEKPRPDSLDQSPFDDGTALVDRLGSALGRGAGGSGDADALDLGRVLVQRNRGIAGAADRLGLRAGPPPAPRARRAARVAA